MERTNAMFINRLNQLYKPERILFFTEISDEEVAEFQTGKVKEEIAKYANAFGTYDFPGAFYLRSLDKIVEGIEYRAGDERIDYPKGLKSIPLGESFFYQVEIEEEVKVTPELIHDIFMKIDEDNDAHRVFSDLRLKKVPDVVGMFNADKKMRILHDMEIEDDRAMFVINDDHSKMDQEELYMMSFTDPITKHYNWNHLSAFIEMPMDKGIKEYAFVHFDIKEFHVLNEVYGHVAANEVLCDVVKKMKESDFVYASARCHNDNFAMLIKDMPEDETIAKLKAFFKDLSYLKVDPNYEIFYRCGVVRMPRSMLMGNRVADAAKMAQSLGTKRSTTDVIIHTDKMHEDVTWSTYIKAYLDTAIDNGEFVVYLQPKFDIHKETAKGAEALIRWNYKKKEFLFPGRFVPFFERDGSIAKVDDIVLKKVCAAFARWKKEGKQLFPISVNLSRDRLYDRNLVNKLTAVVNSYEVDHSLIDFELTESASYDNTEQMIRVLNELRAEGFKISMDDFGTGYSSFSLLTEMPLDTLKIDKSFVDKLGSDKEDEKDIVVTRHIISLAKELGFTCLAEGAETKEQVDCLRIMGCEVIQGFYYSRPIPMEEYEEKYL